MSGRLAAAILVAIAVAAFLAAVYVAKPTGPAESSTKAIASRPQSSGLKIVVTFYNLIYDVKPLLCSGDQVEALVPPGVDPHSYQLSPADVEKVKRADLVISTGHAPFEVKLRNLVPRDRLVEIPRIEGIKLLRNPDTGQPNYHMPIYDPHNYIVFIDYVAHRLAELRPSCSSHYLSAAEKIKESVMSLIRRAPRLDVDAVGSLPPVQYPVEWLGIRVKLLLSPEEGVPPTPGILEEAKRMLREGAVAVVMMRGGEPATPVDARLMSMARELGAPVLRVPAPFLPGSIPSKLRVVVEEAAGLRAGGRG